MILGPEQPYHSGLDLGSFNKGAGHGSKVTGRTLEHDESMSQQYEHTNDKAIAPHHNGKVEDQMFCEEPPLATTKIEPSPSSDPERLVKKARRDSCCSGKQKQPYHVDAPATVTVTMSEPTAIDVPNIVDYVFGGDYDEDKMVLIDVEDETRSVTKTKAREMVDKLKRKFDADTTVCMHLNNNILYPVIYLATLAAGARWMGTNTAYTASELAHLLKLGQARFVLTELAQVATVETAVAMSGVDARIIVCDEVTQPGSSTETAQEQRHPTFLEFCAEPKVDRPDYKIDIDAVAVLMSTSGTTGLPKLAARSHRSIVLESLAIQDPVPKPYKIRRLFCTPIFHAFSSPLMLLAPLREGHITYIMRRFHAQKLADYVEKYQITETAAPPTMLQRLYDVPVEEDQKLRSLRLIWTGGASLAPALKRRFLSIFTDQDGSPRIIPVWGMTEGGWFTTTKHHPSLATRSGQCSATSTMETVGQPLPHIQLKHQHHATTSELLIKSPAMMQCYFNDPIATAAAFDADGWLRTGDLGTYSRPDGQVYLEGRAKDMMKIHGFQVSPAELEAVILEHEAVMDVAVVGATVGEEERAVAFFVAAEGMDQKELEDQLAVLLRQRLAGYKWKSLVYIATTELPRSTAGKVLKGQLKRSAEAWLSDGVC